MAENQKKLRHVEIALNNFKKENLDISKFIELENVDDVKGVSPIVKFTIQSDPISEVGINGCQATDMLIYAKCLFESLQDVLPCEENFITIRSLSEAIKWQRLRTMNRNRRGVEGKIIQ